jgi:hypothetical protein
MEGFMASRQAWDVLTQRLLAKGVALFNGADPPLTEQGQRDPTIVALALLSRTLNTASATVLLLDNERIVEARTLTRSVLENLMFVAALAKKGAAFVQELQADDVVNRQKRANALAAFFDRTGAEAKKADLEVFRQQLIDNHGKPDAIKMFDAATVGGVGDAYIAYRELSTDAAHPSATSISRHIVVPADPEAPFSLSFDPVVEETEAADTLGLLCMGLLGMILAVNELLGGGDAGEPLDDLHRDYCDLDRSASTNTQSNEAVRPAGKGASG